MININKNEFIEICKNSITMAEAARKLKLHKNTLRRYAIQYGCYKPNKGGKGQKSTAEISKISTKDIIEGKYSEYQTYKLKKRLLIEGYKKYQCECCGLTEWNGLQIPLELHHIDGNNTNHKLENLILLCPNCHAQTNNYKSKNKHKNL